MLSDLFIRNVPAPETGVKRYSDKDGLWLQVSQGGTKTFYFIHGPAKSRRYLKIGRYGPSPHVSLAKAREKVKTIIAKQVLGIEEVVSNLTVEKAIEQFTAKHCDVKNKPRTTQETKRLLGYLDSLSRRRISAITTGDVLDIVDDASSSVSERRHVFAAARGFFRWAARQRFIKVSPLNDLQPPGLARSRDRVLTDPR